MKDIYVIDACALIAFLKKEDGFESMIRFFDRSDDDEISLSMHKLNLLEVYYGFYRDDGKDQAEAILGDALSLPIIVIEDLGDPLFLEAGRLKASYDISFADSIALALASVTGGLLITADHHDFGTIEHKEAIRFSWIR